MSGQEMLPTTEQEPNCIFGETSSTQLHTQIKYIPIYTRILGIYWQASLFSLKLLALQRRDGQKSCWRLGHSFSTHACAHLGQAKSPLLASSKTTNTKAFI